MALLYLALPLAVRPAPWLTGSFSPRPMLRFARFAILLSPLVSHGIRDALVGQTSDLPPVDLLPDLAVAAWGLVGVPTPVRVRVNPTLGPSLDRGTLALMDMALVDGAQELVAHLAGHPSGPSDDLSGPEGSQTLEPQAGSLAGIMTEHPRVDQLVVWANGSPDAALGVLQGDLGDRQGQKPADELKGFLGLGFPPGDALVPVETAPCKVGTGWVADRQVVP